ALAKAGGLAAIHAEDNDLVMHMYEKLTREGRTSFHNMAEVHTTLSEDLAFNRVIRLAANIPGSALYMLHTSAATGVRAIAAARVADLYRNGRETRLRSDAVRRPGLDKRGKDHGSLPAQGCDRDRFGRRHRVARYAPAPYRARRRNARGGLFAVGGPRSRRLA